MVSPEHSDRTHDGDEHTVEIEAGDARRADGGKQKPADHCADEPSTMSSRKA